MQHNILGEWLHNSLCLVYEAVGGLCNLAIGPLEEHQAFIPIEFDKLQGPTIIERLEQAQGILLLLLQMMLLPSLCIQKYLRMKTILRKSK